MTPVTVAQVLPVETRVELEPLLTQLNSADARAQPFADQRVKFLNAVSQHIFKHVDGRAFPELFALAFFLRESAVRQWESAYRKMTPENAVPQPRGLVFHITPANVDTIFVYSWAVSFLCGNSNILRLSSRQTTVMSTLCAALKTVLEQPEFVSLQRSTAFVSYGHEQALTSAISQACDARMIWGGDNTIRTIRESPLSLHGKDIVFGDKYSLSLLSIDAVRSASDEACAQLATQFFNDAYWFDQLGCSSPRAVMWVGKNDDLQAARQRFWSHVGAIVAQKKYQLDPALHFSKMTAMYSAAMNEAPVHPLRATPQVTAMLFDQLQPLSGEHPGGGFFLEYRVDEPQQVTPMIQRKNQTITTFGIEAEAARALLVGVAGHGIDRIVPVGQALTFQPVWDGSSLFHELTRWVDFRVG